MQDLPAFALTAPDIAPWRAGYDDCVLVMPSLRQARAGVTVVRFAHRRRIEKNGLQGGPPSAITGIR